MGKKELESYGISTQSMFDRNEIEKKRTTSVDSSEKETTSIWGKTKSTEGKNNATREKLSSRWKNVASTAKDVLKSHTKKSSDYSSSKEDSVSSKNKNSRQQRYRMATEEGKA